MKPGAILATNTSTLDIDQIAAATKRPGDVVGLHFFSPANVTRLLEIVRTDSVARDVLATAFAIARKVKKTGVLSKVSYGFIGNRMMDPYAREAERLTLEGATPAEVDAALEDFGMGMGILAVFDMAGVDVGVKARRANRIMCPATIPRSIAPRSCCSTAAGWARKAAGVITATRPVRASGCRTMKHRRCWLMKAGGLGIARGEPISREEIVERCIYAMINEGAKLLEEGVALRPGDIDVVYTSGYAFPRHRGGPMFHADQIGLATVLAGLNKYAKTGNPQDWKPSVLLEQLAESGSTFAEWAAARA